jgi:phosphoribosyl 1,2-cyclic phosphodiesterase
VKPFASSLPRSSSRSAALPAFAWEGSILYSSGIDRWFGRNGLKNTDNPAEAHHLKAKRIMSVSLRSSSDLAPALTFWGVRGSLPRPGPGTIEFGGNTTCLEVDIPLSGGMRSVVIDAGSGIYNLGRSRDWKNTRRVDLLFTHLHHDHVMGLPFFNPLLVPGLELHLWCGNLGGETAEKALDQIFSSPLFPVHLSQMPARVIHHGFCAGETIDVAGVHIRTVLLEHPSGATGYRFDAPGGSIAVITDIEHSNEGPAAEVVALCQNIDTLIYDTMMTDPEFEHCNGWGHSNSAAGVALARAAQARRLIGFHHSPKHDDAMMRQREADLKAAFAEAMMAREGQKIVGCP